jgi:pimeloyl-ACP methyl ester carboxylesterase
MENVMNVPSSSFVNTSLGRLHVTKAGDGPPVVLWHSLFFDSRSWGPLIDTLSARRTVYAIDGPSHGRSDPVDRDFTFAECVRAAEEALDQLGLHVPVDWVGNAWGGHIGIRLATGSRLRTLTTIGTPIQGFSWAEKWTMAAPLVTLYRLLGPTKFLTDTLCDKLIGPEGVAAQPDQAGVIRDSFRTADRAAMFHAMRSMMLHRTGIENLLGDIAVPTLVMSARDDKAGWRPEEARRTCTAIADCRVQEVAGAGHVAPLLLDADTIAQSIADFWQSADCTP